MIHVLRDRPMNHHASNLGAAIAYRIAQPLGIPAYIYDPVTVDEMIDVVRITGLKEVLQFGQGHNLNMRAAALEYCRRTGTDYRSVNLIVAHLGGGISISLQSSGRIIDMVSDEEGPFSPERAGLIPNFKLLRLVYKDPNNTYESMMRLLQRKGGLMSHFGTTDTVAVESMAKSGDKYARLVYGAMALNVAKHIAALSTVVYGKVHQIILTGGIAYSKTFTAAVAERVSYLAPVYVLPGEKGMEALAKGALRVLSGQEEAQVYDSSVQRPLLSIDRLPD